MKIASWAIALFLVTFTSAPNWCAEITTSNLNVEVGREIRRQNRSRFEDFVESYNQGRGNDGFGQGPYSNEYIADQKSSLGLQNQNTTHALQFYPFGPDGETVLTREIYKRNGKYLVDPNDLNRSWKEIEDQGVETSDAHFPYFFFIQGCREHRLDPWQEDPSDRVTVPVSFGMMWRRDRQNNWRVDQMFLHNGSSFGHWDERGKVWVPPQRWGEQTIGAQPITDPDFVNKHNEDMRFAVRLWPKDAPLIEYGEKAAQFLNYHPVGTYMHEGYDCQAPPVVNYGLTTPRGSHMCHRLKREGGDYIERTVREYFKDYYKQNLPQLRAQIVSQLQAKAEFASFTQSQLLHAANVDIAKWLKADNPELISQNGLNDQEIEELVDQLFHRNMLDHFSINGIDVNETIVKAKDYSEIPHADIQNYLNFMSLVSIRSKMSIKTFAPMSIDDLVSSMDRPLKFYEDRAVKFIFQDGLDRGAFPFTALYDEMLELHEKHQASPKDEVIKKRYLDFYGLYQNAIAYERARQNNGNYNGKSIDEIRLEVERFSRSLIRNYDGQYPIAFLQDSTAKKTLRVRNAYVQRKKFYEMTVEDKIREFEGHVNEKTAKAIQYIFSDGLDRGKFPFSKLDQDIANADGARKNLLSEFRELSQSYLANLKLLQTEEHKNNVELQRIHQQNKLRLSQLARNLIENYEGVYPSAFEDPNTAQETLKTREIYRNGIAYMKRTGDYTPNHHSRQIPQTEDLQLNQTEQDKLLANRAGFYRAFVEMLKLEYGRNIEKGECKAHFEKVLAHLQKLKALSGRLIEWEAPSGVEIAAYGFQPQFSEARNRPKKIEENPAEVPHAQPAITVPSRRPSGGFRGIRDILFRRGQ